MRKSLIAGNWKMNGLSTDVDKLNQLDTLLANFNKQIDIAICVPFTIINQAVGVTSKTKKVSIGAQDCHFNKKGAHTGDISPQMLKDSGCKYVILGHSERRANHFETDEIINKKVSSAIEENLIAILCVGETKEEKEKGLTLDVVKKQLVGSIPSMANSTNMVIAYEPVWAIGTGLTPENKDIDEVHSAIRKMLADIISAGEADKIRILYGGSLNPKNANEILAIQDVDGGLIGGASLLPEDFNQIIINVKENR